jgi:hypothetical protein
MTAAGYRARGVDRAGLRAALEATRTSPGSIRRQEYVGWPHVHISGRQS